MGFDLLTYALCKGGGSGCGVQTLDCTSVVFEDSDGILMGTCTPDMVSVFDSQEDSLRVKMTYDEVIVTAQMEKFYDGSSFFWTGVFTLGYGTIITVTYADGMIFIVSAA